ncbi:glycosyltransferase family 4 protein [Leptospira sarikeiensis]|uniref:Glycosyltransferase family 1 protein n=1 Tax=Leptospira sarikeiensis TaxID=2484943 RepID=A0A4V3JSI3_9LEPT|nr:glycosyltransferase family 1 protein [Leptospira sarikeiensis]TGL65706.1 glycosyltransferase family 1 protein [Leptospira sarikeiensis]
MYLNQEKYRIALDARPLSTPVSGVGRLIESVLKGFEGDPNFEFYLFSSRPIHEGYSSLFKNPNIKAVIGKGPLAKKGGLYFAFYLPFQIRKYQIDLFWGTQQVFPPFLPKRIPGFLTYHDFVAYRFPETMRTIARLQQLFYLKRSIKRASFVFANSKFTASELQKYYSYPKDRIRVIYPGYEPKEIRKIKTPPTSRVKDLPAKFFLTVSTLEPRKNFQTLFRAYEKLKKEKSDLVWVHAGKAGWEDPAFLEKFKQASDSKELYWLDFVTDEELHYLYSKAKLFLFPSIYEGFGIPLLEALAYSLPCIVSNLEVFHEIGKKSCKYVPPLSEDHWVKAIVDFQKKNVKFPKADLKKFERKKSAYEMKTLFLMWAIR